MARRRPSKLPVWHFQAATQRCAAASDWTGLAAATAALYAFTGGKGKGGKGGKGDKGGGKGANRDGSAFTGECYHCGEPGHRKFECPKANDGKPDKGKGKGKSGKGDKGKGKGGKSLDYAGVDEGAAEQAPATEEEWWMGAQYSVVRELPDQHAVPTHKPVPTSTRSTSSPR